MAANQNLHDTINFSDESSSAWVVDIQIYYLPAWKSLYSLVFYEWRNAYEVLVSVTINTVDHF